MNILVCGGAGYIGSHMVKMLVTAGHEVVVFDNFSTGHRSALRWGRLVEGDLLDAACLKELFSSCDFDAVMHFSARSLVGESVADPGLYYRNNVVGTSNLLAAMLEDGVTKFIFSSSAATFGNPQTETIDEAHPQVPINPYGRSKLMIEQMLEDYAAAYGLNSVSLRYFNAAGADRDGELGENHQPETHLIPNVLKAALGGTALKVFGSDYATEDGTCVRDYVHVEDLCRAHLRALEYLDDNAGAHFFNLGNGKGFSILQVIRAASFIVGRDIPFEYVGKRDGDPAMLVANCSLAGRELQWQPEYIDIHDIIRTAWDWCRKFEDKSD